MGLWAKHDDSQVADLLRQMYRARQDDFTPLFESLAAMNGRRFRPPFAARDLAVATAALSEGVALRGAVDPGAVRTDLQQVPSLLGEADDPDEPDWDLVSACVYLLAVGMTEPAEPRDAAVRSRKRP
jgi:hypothetical protein